MTETFVGISHQFVAVLVAAEVAVAETIFQ
jgi:hypothetical protein